MEVQGWQGGKAQGRAGINGGATSRRRCALCARWMIQMGRLSTYICGTLGGLRCGQLVVMSVELWMADAWRPWCVLLGISIASCRASRRCHHACTRRRLGLNGPSIRWWWRDSAQLIREETGSCSSPKRNTMAASSGDTSRLPGAAILHVTHTALYTLTLCLSRSKIRIPRAWAR